jgi:NAD(P)-dependent dehydrogenase (short-subunit alcohol dehydrogenase family)
VTRTGPIPDQSGRTIVITGATSGLGLSSAHALAGAGARVVLAARNPSKAETTRAEVTKSATGPAPEVLALDLSDLESVRSAADELKERFGSVDVLMNNAGVMAPPLGRTAQGFEMQFGTNHLGHFAFTGLVLSSLLAAPAPRVVTTSSNAHKPGRMRWHDLQWTKGYGRWRAYAQSKLANLLFTSELDRRAQLEGSNLIAAAAHPGYAATHLQSAAADEHGKRAFDSVMQFGNRLIAQDADAGARPQIYAATAPGVVGGEYFGPDGFMEMRGAAQRTKVSRRARDAAEARRLWDISERLTDVRYDWGAASPR